MLENLGADKQLNPPEDKIVGYCEICDDELYDGETFKCECGTKAGICCKVKCESCDTYKCKNCVKEWNYTGTMVCNVCDDNGSAMEGLVARCEMDDNPETAFLAREYRITTAALEVEKKTAKYHYEYLQKELGKIQLSEDAIVARVQLDFILGFLKGILK